MVRAIREYAERTGVGQESAQLRVGQHLGDEQHGVGAGEAGFDELVAVEDEVFPQER